MWVTTEIAATIHRYRSWVLLHMGEQSFPLVWKCWRKLHKSKTYTHIKLLHSGRGRTEACACICELLGKYIHCQDLRNTATEDYSQSVQWFTTAVNSANTGTVQYWALQIYSRNLRAVEAPGSSNKANVTFSTLASVRLTELLVFCN